MYCRDRSSTSPAGACCTRPGATIFSRPCFTRAAGRSTLALARSWIGEPLGVDIPAWTRDPQGVYLGGNNMALSPRALLRFGEMYRRGGIWQDRRVLSESWIRASWTPRTRSRFTGHSYGYGWFMASARGHRVYYAWGYGGQMLYTVPDLALTVVMTSGLTPSPDRRGHSRRLHTLFAQSIVRAAERGMRSEM